MMVWLACIASGLIVVAVSIIVALNARQSEPGDKEKGTPRVVDRTPKDSTASNKDRKPTDQASPKEVDDRKPDDQATNPPPVLESSPRRALVISVHNYLFANPLTVGDSDASGRNIHNFVGRLNQGRGFHIASNQIAFLSDAAQTPFKVHPPIKTTIEGTITEFLSTSRARNRIVLLFVGHAVEINGEVYIASIESDLTSIAGMIPLKWLYQQLEQCKAQQKVLILDVCRQNLARGDERASFGPMTAKFDQALKNPPAGVQVWSACTEGQFSYEFENARINNSVFLDALYHVADKGIEGMNQKPDDPIHVEKFVDLVNNMMKKDLDPLKLVQTSRLSGSMGTQEATNLDTKPVVEPTIVTGMRNSAADPVLVRAILKEASVPPIKKQQNFGLMRYEAMPTFEAVTLEKYPIDNTPNELRDAVESAQAILWAISPNPAPPELTAAVQKIKMSGELKGDLSSMKESYLAPADSNAELALKEQLLNDGRQAASILRLLEEELDNLKKVGAMKKDVSRRWQVNYDFFLARMQLQIAYLYEYSSMVGVMRKEFPPRDPALHRGWRLASNKNLVGDGVGRKLVKEAEKVLDRLILENPGTPWELLARREKMTALGLQWKPN
jgi:hypothetical protein